jgi:hypothetical protein
VNDFFFSIYLILPPAHGSVTEMITRRREVMFLESRARPVRGADNLTAIFEQIVETMWDRRHSCSTATESVCSPNYRTRPCGPHVEFCASVPVEPWSLRHLMW